MTMTYDKHVWAKSNPYCTLSQHMIAVGACAETYLSAKSSAAILRRLGDWLGMVEEDAVKCVAYAFALHDIGKAHPFFQYRREGVYDALKGMGFDDTRSGGNPTFRHEAYGASAIKTIWNKMEASFPGEAQDLFAAVIRLHHQGKALGTSTNPAPMWMEIQRDLEQRIRTLFRVDGVSPPSVSNADALGVLLTALLVLCDWVASSEAFGICESGDDNSCHEWARKRAQNTLEHFGLIHDTVTAFPDETDFCEFWKAIPRSGMHPLQRTCEITGDTPAALTIIEAPPGEGKTEAALYLAGRLCAQRGLHGVYMALPTAATSNQMVERVSAMLESHGIGKARLLHGTAWMLDDVSTPPSELNVEDAQQASDWLRPLRRGMLSENAVGTVDQAMASVLLIKYGMLRLAGLAEKVLIIDEIHAYDAYMSRIIARLLDWCKVLEIPVILLSATLQQSQKDKYIACYTGKGASQKEGAYPLITRVDADGNESYYPVDGAYIHTQFQFVSCQILGDVGAVADLAQEKTRDGGCLCVMLNTVARAQAVYSELRQRGEENVMLFHARFRMYRRAEIERACLKAFGKSEQRPRRMILVCTQVVEQSLDVDFDGMITEIAPVDLLIQRAGRVHRHAGVCRPANLREREIVVLVPKPGATEELDKRYGSFGAIYAPCVLNSTERWLGEGKTVRVPEDVRGCVERVYQHMDEQIEAFVKKQAEDESKETAAEGCIYPVPYDDEFFGEMESEGQKLNMEDSESFEDQLRRNGARTRDGEDSVCIAFLPKDYQPKATTTKAQAKELMQYGCNVRLTNGLRCDMMETKSIITIKVARPESDGSYLLGDQQFYMDDEMGLRKE